MLHVVIHCNLKYYENVFVNSQNYMNIFTLSNVRISVIYHYGPIIFGPMRYRLVQSKFSGRDRGGSEGIWKVLSLIESE